MAKKKLLILIDWFYPGYLAGGPIASCKNICIALGEDFDIYVLTTDTDHGVKEPYSNIQVGQWIYCKDLKCQINYLPKDKLSFRLMVHQIQLLSPEFVYLNHLFSPYFVVAPLFYRLFTNSTAKWIVCPRGALFPSALNQKRYKKTPVMWLYRFFKLSSKVIFHATNKDEAVLIEKYFNKPTIRLAENIPDLHQPPFEKIDKREHELKCVFVARIVPIKNLFFLLTALKHIDFKNKIQLAIIGPKEDESYWQSCLDFIKELPENIVVKDHGPLSPDLIKKHLLNNHVLVLPTQGENFGHSIFQALQHGRPVLISDQTPWKNLQDKKAGWDISLKNPSAFSETFEAMASYNQDEYDRWAKGAWELANQYIHLFKWDQEYKTLFS